jgi:hypothetical protein
MLLRSTKYMGIVNPDYIDGNRYEKIANILMGLEVYCVAVELYKAINDMDMVKKCYKEMFKLTNSH